MSNFIRLPIKVKRTDTVGKVPVLNVDISPGEIAINLEDDKIFYGTNNGVVDLLDILDGVASAIVPPIFLDVSDPIPTDLPENVMIYHKEDGRWIAYRTTDVNQSSFSEMEKLVFGLVIPGN